MFRFTIDTWLDRYLWPNQVRRLPKPVARFLGGHSPKPVPDYLIWLEILVASFCGIAVIEGVFKSHTVFSHHHSVLIIASYGASAILCFNASQVPLAQPRNVFFGHVLSSVIGVCVQKLFALSAGGKEHYWAGGAFSVAIASVAMSIFNCVHPPGGASALLPCVEEEVRLMGWWYVVYQIVSSLLMIGVACITGNVFRRYPVFWWLPGHMGRLPAPDAETQLPLPVASEKQGVIQSDEATAIQIGPDSITVPAGTSMDELETEWLYTLQKCLPP